jgi:Cdc6-like AAA superfamily ATPase
MKPLSEIQKAETREWLKKQRDGYIVGNYRNILYHVYQEIKSISMNDGYCTLKGLVKEDTIYYRTEAQVLELCDILNTLGYIDIRNHPDGVTLNILKPIDF